MGVTQNIKAVVSDSISVSSHSRFLRLAKRKTGGGAMEGLFQRWVGQPVILQVTLGQLKISLRGKILEELRDTLLMRPQCGPDLEISKTKVLAIEETGLPFAERQA
jgi:hypothetical protein